MIAERSFAPGASLVGAQPSSSRALSLEALPTKRRGSPRAPSCCLLPLTLPREASGARQLCSTSPMVWVERVRRDRPTPVLALPSCLRRAAFQRDVPVLFHSRSLPSPSGTFAAQAERGG